MVTPNSLSLRSITLVCALLASQLNGVDARSIPSNLQSFYDALKGKPCSHPLQGGFKDGQENTGFSYCGDHDGLIYLTGPESKALGDMDIDCDGAANTAGKCSNDPSGQSQTAFKDTVKTYGVSDLNANIHSYIVFGNEGENPSFDPQKAGMKPLSVMAVVCNNQLFYGVWGDTNGGVDTGEASISLATACFPNDGITADNGHTDHDVLYVGFTDESAVPGKNGANWKAKSFEDFEASLSKIGDALVAKIPSS